MNELIPRRNTRERRKFWNDTLASSIGTSQKKCNRNRRCVIMLTALATSSELSSALIPQGAILFQPMTGGTNVFVSFCPFCGGKLAP